MSAQERLRAALLHLGEFAMYDEKMRAARDAAFVAASEAIAESDALAATVERLIREAGAIRADERKRAKADEDALVSAAHQRAIDRVDLLEGEVAKLRQLVDDADRAKAEHAATRDELRRLHDVLSGAPIDEVTRTKGRQTT